MRELLTRQLFIVFNLVLALALAGCGGASPLGNGEIKTGLTGKAGSEKKFSIVIPENTEAVMVQAAGSENVSLQVVDKDDQLVAFCSQPTLCSAFQLARGTYTVKLQGLASYSNVSLTAAWGGPSLASMQNNTPRVLPVGLANTVGLNSFYINNANVPVKLQRTGVDRANVTTEIIDANDNQRVACPTNGDCLVGGLSRGLYFVRHTASADYTDISLTVSWGGADSATLRNGVPLTQLSGAAGSVVWHSFYIPANTSAFMVQGSQSNDFSIDVYDIDGMPVDTCTEYDPCSREQPAEGLYSVAVRFHANVSSMSLVAAWGGPAVATLGNGVPVTGLSGVAGQRLLHSLYIPEGMEHLAVQISGMDFYGHVELLEGNGQVVDWCSVGDLCTLSAPRPGVYFVRVFFVEATAGANLVAAWAGPAVSTLSNSLPVTGLSGVAGQHLLHSMYVPEGIEHLAVQISGMDFYGHVELLEGNGQVVDWCSVGDLCTLSAPRSGAYFVRVFFVEATAGVNLVAAWAGPAVSTLSNSVPVTGLTGVAGQHLLHSMYVPEGIEHLAVQISGWNFYGHVELLEGNGQTVEWCGVGDLCTLSAPRPGVYFVRVWFAEARAGVNLVAAWAGPAVSTLSSGVPVTGLTGAAGQHLLHAMYVPEGIEHVAVQISGMDFLGHVELLENDGRAVGWCGAQDMCHLSAPRPGVYFVRIWFGDAISGINLVAAWAGPAVSTLSNGVPVTGLSGVARQQLLHSIYVPQGTEQLAVQISGMDFNGHVELLEDTGHAVDWCSVGDLCTLSAPRPGVYFVRVWFGEAASGVSLVAAWAGPDNATLTNGVPLIDLSGEADQQLLQSLYIPMNVERLVVQPAGMMNGFAELLDSSGRYVRSCDNYSPCELDFPAPGAYFVRLRLFQAQSGMSVLASW